MPRQEPPAGGPDDKLHDPEQDGPPVDDRRASETDQTLSDADQVSSDLDQTTSDADQGSSERDQFASDRDQAAADIDEAAIEEAVGPGSVADASAASFAGTRRTRSATALERDLTTHARSEGARIRDVTADRRDRDADARDAAARARDRLAAELDADIERQEKASGNGDSGLNHGLEILLRASRDRQRASAGRARAAAHREQAARDRALAQRDRMQAAADRRNAAAELAEEGMDHLTGALRRRVGLAAIQREMDRVLRTGEPHVLAFVDVDGLKAVNDTHGHAVGDELLRAVADCIKQALRPYDLIMRFGGDEFLCSMSGEGLHGIRDRFDGIAERIAAARDGATITVGLVEGTSNESLDTLIDRASQAMLAARGRS